MYLKDKKFAFTMPELLIVLGLLGVIAALTLPTVFKLLPNKDEQNLQKITYSLSNMVAQMHNDDTMYPKLMNFTKEGFRNTDKVTIKNVDYDGETKFCKLLASRFEKMSKDVNCLKYSDTPIDADGAFTYTGNPTFTTTDKIDWFVNEDDFSKGYTAIVFDVNGKDCPNTTDLKYPAQGCNGKYKIADRKKFYIRANGTLVQEEPEEANNDELFAIKPEIVCNDGAEPEQCGRIKIAQIKKDNDGNRLPLQSSNFTTIFNRLKLGETYVIAAIPNDKYYSGWTKPDTYKNLSFNGQTNIGIREITIKQKSQNIYVTVRFSPHDYHRIFAHINNCYETNATTGKTDISQCVSSITWKRYSDWTDGKAKGKQLESGNFTRDDENGLYKTDEIKAGNYELTFQTKPPYRVSETIIDQSSNLKFYQYIKLGTEDINYDVNLKNDEKTLYQCTMTYAYQFATGIYKNCDGTSFKISLDNVSTGYDENGKKYEKTTTDNYECGRYCESGKTCVANSKDNTERNEPCWKYDDGNGNPIYYQEIKD